MTDTLTAPRSPRKAKYEHDPIRAAEAAKALVESLRAMADGDDDLIADMVEGETDLFEIIDRLVARINENKAYVRGLDAQVEDLKARQDRFAKRVDFDRTLIEQALTIADLPKVERAGATLSMAARAPKVVIDAEADIPASYWKPGEPRLDRAALAEALRERTAERLVRLADWRAEHGEDAPPPNDLPPEIPGAHIEDQTRSLTLRVR